MWALGSRLEDFTGLVNCFAVKERCDYMHATYDFLHGSIIGNLNINVNLVLYLYMEHEG